MLNDELRDAFEADVLYSGHRLKDLTYRELSLMATSPVPHGALYNAVAKTQNNDKVPWTDDQQLLSALINSTNEVAFQLQWSNFNKQDDKYKTKSREPKRAPIIYPPGQEPPPPPMLTKAKDVAAWFGKLSSK